MAQGVRAFVVLAILCGVLALPAALDPASNAAHAAVATCQSEAAFTTSETSWQRIPFWVPAGQKVRLRIEGSATERPYYAYMRLQGNPEVGLEGPGISGTSLGMFDWYYDPQGNPPQFRAFSYEYTYTAPYSTVYTVGGQIGFYFGGSDLMWRFTATLVDSAGNPVGPDPNCIPQNVLLGGCNPSIPVRETCDEADPVSLPTGNYYDNSVDLAIAGRGPDLAVSRTYNSLAAGVDGPLGFGWSFSYDMRLVRPDPDGPVIIRQENGSEVTFDPLPGGGFAAPPYLEATLDDDGGGAYTFTRRGTETFEFSNGQLVTIRDRNGYETDLTYSGGQLASATDASGRTISFSWTPEGRIDTVTDSSVSPARVVDYGYDGDGNLSTVVDVNGGQTGEASSTSGPVPPGTPT